MSFLVTQARWEKFLTKIKEKFDETMSKSEEALYRNVQRKKTSAKLARLKSILVKAKNGNN